MLDINEMEVEELQEVFDELEGVEDEEEVVEAIVVPEPAPIAPPVVKSTRKAPYKKKIRW